MIVVLEMILWVLRFSIGACIFSFLNVVIYRLPAGEDMVRGRSHCMTCGRTLTAGELIPLFSYALQRGRCKGCGEKISPRYFCVESVGGAAFVGCSAFFKYSEDRLISMQGLLVFAFLAVLMVVAMIDWDTQLIYNRFPVIIAGMSVIAYFMFPEHGPVDRLIGAVVIALPMLVLTLVIMGAFGGGDIKLMATAGLFLGWRAMIVAAFIALLTGGGYGAWMLMGKKLEKGDHFAFGPFLALGLAIAAFYGDQMMSWYINICLGR